MLFVEDLKPMKIYTKPLYLPTVEGDKKKGSAIFLLTPNYESSKALLNSNLFINKMRFQSYYIEKDLTYFISSKVMDKVDDVTETYVHNYSQLDFYHSLYEMTSAERKKLKDSDFGLPKKRKYPLTDKSHVKSAIKFFNYVDEEDEAELARNLNRAIKKFFSAEELPKVGENNRFSKYYKQPKSAIKESSIEDEKEQIFSLYKYLSGFDYGKFEGPKNYRTRSSKEFEKIRNGVCWDFANYIEVYCNKHNLDCQLYYYVLEKAPDYPNHTFPIIKIGNQWYMVEASWRKHSGIYTSKNRSDLLSMVYNWMVIEENPKPNETLWTYTYTSNDKLVGMNGLEFTTWLMDNAKEIKVSNKKTNVFQLTEPLDQAVYEACKDLDTARKFVYDVGKLAKKYNANYFIVTDGASGYSNQGNPAVKNARNSQIDWEKKNGYDPDEDWTGTIREGANISNLRWYHFEPTRPGFNPKGVSGWDEEQYYPSLDEAVKHFAVPEDKDSQRVHVFTIGEQIEDVYYLGILNIIKTSNGKVDYEWDETSGISDGMISYLYDEQPRVQHNVSEAVISDEPDIYYNKDKFESGETNLCFITGYSGSGKSTMTNGMPDDIVKISLDEALSTIIYSMDEYKAHNEVEYLFYKKNLMKYYTKDVDKEYWRGKDYDTEICRDFIKFCIDYAESHKDKKFVVEGIQLFMYIEPKMLKDYAVYIKGTSALKSAWRAAKRDVYYDKGAKVKDAARLGLSFENLIKFGGLYAKRGIKGVDEYRKYFGKRITIREGYISDEPDIYYNKDSFENGDINLCFITGLCGSGKSTMASSMDGKNGIESYEIDDVLANANWFTMDNFKEYGDLIYSFFKGPGQKYYTVKDKKKVAEADPNAGDGNYDKNITTDFVNYCIKYAKSHKNKKFVINGVQLLFFIDPSYLKDYAVYIKGTSALKSLYRAARRDGINKGDDSKLRILKRMYKRSKHVQDNEKLIDEWRDYYSKLGIVAESTNIINTPENPVESVSALILDEGKILVENHSKCNAYTIPGGKVNEGESPDETLIRELGEELCINPVEYEPYCTNTFICEYPVGSGIYVWFKDYCYKILRYEGEMKNNEPEKHLNIKYVTFDDLMFGKLPISKLLECVISYIQDNDIEDENCYDISPDKITCSGYSEDIKLLKDIATPEIYSQLLISLQISCDNDKVPQINLIGSDREDVIVNGDTIDVYMYSQSLDNLSVQQYYSVVIELMSIGLIHYFYPNLKGTKICRMIVSYLFDSSDTEEHQFIEKLIDDTCGSLHDLFEKANEVYCVYGSDAGNKCLYNDARDLGFKFAESLDYFAEKKEITADSLTRSLKYRSSTKTKIAVGKLRNTVGKLTNRIKSSIRTKTKAKVPDTKVKPVKKETVKKESASLLEALSEGAYIVSGDYVTIFEDSTYDPQLRRILYKERMVKRKDVLELLDRVKADVPDIKYAYPDLSRYQGKNLFIDLYYYNQAFFKNNDWKAKRGFNLYLDFLDRLINDKRIIAAGYKRRTVFLPISDWSKNPTTRMWLYREDINPISILYELMVNNPNGLKKLLGNVEVVFFDKRRYFKVNFNTDAQTLKRTAVKFKLFISKILKNEEFDEEDKDSTEETPNAKAIKTDIVDKVEISKGIDLSSADKKVQDEKKAASKNKPSPADSVRIPDTSPAVKKRTTKTSTTSSTKKIEEPKTEVTPDKSKASQNKPIARDRSSSDEEVLKSIIKNIDKAVAGTEDEDEALNYLDSDEFKELVLGLDSSKDDSVNINAARAERMTQLDRELLNKDIKGRSIKDILGEVPEEGVNPKAELPKTNLKVSSPNEEWRNMSYMNFDKTYDLEKDLVNIFKYWSKVSRPLSIRNIKAEDNSTSQDLVDLYTVEYEDYRGKRYTIKLDIPKMKNGRFLLRGDYQMIQTQFFNMPILKTDLDTAQIVTNYKKIIIFRYNTSSGRSMPNVARFMKALGKYKGTNIKITTGDNTRICAKYVLPIDYIDISTQYSTIETPDYKFYFNQDQLREEYEVKDALGVPYGVDKKNKTILYFSNKSKTPMVDTLYELIAFRSKGDKEFERLFNEAKPPARCTFVMAKIMGSYIPLVVVCAYSEGLRTVLKKANIKYEMVDKLRPDQKNSPMVDYIRFNDGYLVYEVDYFSSLLMNGLKDCDTEGHSIMQIDDKNMYLDFLDNYGGRIKADGLDNFYDCEIDPITEETLRYYKLPTDYISVLLYANYLLADNKFIKHTDTSSRRARRLELVAAYTYQVMSEVYGNYSTAIKHNHKGTTFTCKQSAVIDKIIADPTFSNYSTVNMVNDLECTNAISTKGLSGMNNDRSYSLDKRTYDDSMIGVIGMSTGFSGNVGITRQATLDAGIEGNRGYVKDNKGSTKNMNTATTLTATESIVPMTANHDDPMRIAMTFIQSSKHSLRTEHSDPLLVTSGSDEAIPYMCSDQFAYKAKADGIIKDLTDQFIIVEYKDGSKDYINLVETIEKNSDGGFYVPLKLDADKKLKIGSKVKENQILAYDKYSISNSLGETDNLAYNVGKLAKIAIINTDDGYEDAGIITSKMAKDLASKIIMKHTCTLAKDTNIYNVKPVGQHVEQGDALITWQTPYDEEEANALLKALADDKETIGELGSHNLKAETTGTLVDMKVYRTVEKDELSPSLKNLVNKYEKPISDLQKKLKDEGVEGVSLPANYALKPTGKLKGASDGVLIEFYVEYLDTVGVGDKITYNAANKAVIKNIIPEGQEPYTDFRPNEEISAFVSETSITKRLVTSTNIYGSLQKLMVELDRSCKDLAGIPYDDSSV